MSNLTCQTPTPTAVEFSEKLAFLFEPAPIKVIYGGRGGIKSWGAAQALLIEGAQKPLRTLCTRELQKSIAESVHHLLETQIERLGLGGFYAIEKSRIYGRHANGDETEFVFSGLRDAQNLKSYEAVDRCWVEEANNVSKRSWDMLLPTIRKAGSEVWITFNPELDSDETYKRFVLDPPPGAVVCKTSWRDNKWLTPELRRQIQHLRHGNPDDFLHIYEGHCKQTVEGAVYAGELRAALADGRIGRVPYDPRFPVHTFWDLGWADNTSIWFAQSVAFEYRLIDYYESARQPLSHYLQQLQQRPYVYGRHYLPHDARAKSLGTGKSIEELMQEAGLVVKIAPSLSIADGINAARTVFPLCHFDQRNCADGLQKLRKYRFAFDEKLNTFSKVPVHDDASHGSDGFRYFAVAMTPDKSKKKSGGSGDGGRGEGWAWG